MSRFRVDSGLLITFFVIAVLLAAMPLASAQDVWNGGGADDLWTTNGNWVGGVAPTGNSSSQDLSFASTNIQLSNTQPVMGTNTFGNIAITRKNVVLNGTTTMLLFGGITTTYGTGTSTSNINTSISAAQTFTVGTGGTFVQAGNMGLNANLGVGGAGDITISGNITNAGNINKTGSGTLTISGAANNYTGTNTYSGGLTLINSTLGGSVTHVVATGGTLSGTGNTGTGSVTGTGGTIDPGNVGTVGTLTSAAVTLGSTTTLNIDTNGNGVNDNYAVTSINLGSASLLINHLAAPANGNSWIIVTSSGTISGVLTNAGAPICDSVPFTQNGGQYTITYPNPTGVCGAANGSGNVVLTYNRANTPPSNITFAPASFNANEGAVATLTVNFTDPDAADPHTITVDWADGQVDGPTAFTSGNTVTHTYLNNPTHPAATGPYSIGVTITDSGNASATNNKTITVHNVTPSTIVVNQTNSSDPEGTSTSIDGTFVDGSPTNSSDDHDVTVDWGDGSAVTDLGNLGAGVLTYNSSHTYTDVSPSGTSSAGVSIKVTVTDMDNAAASKTVTHTITNVAPTLASAPVNITGSCSLDLSNADFNLWTATCPVRVVATFTDPGTEGATFTVDVKYSDIITTNFDSAQATGQSSPSTVDHSLTFFIFKGPITACTTVTDHNTGVSNQVCNNFTFNHPPSGTEITSVTPSPSNEGALVTLNGDFDDNDGTVETHTIVLNWGDGTADQIVTATADGDNIPFQGTHTYADNGVYTITVKSNTDASATSDPGLPITTSHTVSNVAPTMNTVAVTSGNENDTVTLTGNIVDPGVLDNFDLAIDWKDGSAVQHVAVAAAATSFSVQHQYLDDKPTATASDIYVIALTLTDKDGGSGVGSASSTIANVDPAFGTVTVTNGLFPGDVTTLSGSITDVGTLDTHQVVITWGDGSLNTTINRSAGVTTYNTTHNYALGGPYSISIAGSDDDTGTASTTSSATVPDFAITAPTASATVVAGQTGPFTIRAASVFAPFTVPVHLTCNGLPAGAACSFAAPTVIPGATFVDDNLSISTTLAGLGAPPIPNPNEPVYAKLFSFGSFGMVGAVLMVGSRRKNRKLMMTGMLLLVLGLVIFLPGCGATGAGTSNNTGSGTNAVTSSPTPPGTYTITVTGTFNGPPVTAHATTITLTVN